MDNPITPIQFFIDQPGNWAEVGRCAIVRGWCFAADGKPVRAIRLRTRELTLFGLVGLPRPDVKAALPAAPDDNCGFEIRGTLPSGTVRVLIEVQLADGTWVQLLDRTVTVRRLILPLWLGGGEWTDFMFFQMPAHMAYPARPVSPERYPALRNTSPPKLAVVTPSFNHARFLGQTMQSVLGQSGVDCQYVVQDGGSTDGSRELLAAAAEGLRGKGVGLSGDTEPKGKDRKPYAEAKREEAARNEAGQPSSRLRPPTSHLPRLVAWESAPDSGQADAIVRGFAKTSGAPDDIMAWLNSDDFYLPGSLPFVANFFARHPEIDVIYGHRIVVDEDSHEIARWFLPKHQADVLRLNDFVPQETMFWRRRIWDKVGGLDSSFKFAMDWDLLLRFQAAGANIVRVPYFLACFRVHAAQKTAAQMGTIGRREIDALRRRSLGREMPPAELEQHHRLLRYLRRSAFIEFLWKFGIRAP